MDANLLTALLLEQLAQEVTTSQLLRPDTTGILKDMKERHSELAILVVHHEPFDAVRRRALDLAVLTVRLALEGDPTKPNTLPPYLRGTGAMPVIIAGRALPTPTTHNSSEGAIEP